MPQSPNSDADVEGPLGVEAIIAKARSMIAAPPITPARGPDLQLGLRSNYWRRVDASAEPWPAAQTGDYTQPSLPSDDQQDADLGDGQGGHDAIPFQNYQQHRAVDPRRRPSNGFDPASVETVADKRPGRSSSQPAASGPDTTTPYQLGWEWLTGTAKDHHFGPNDDFTQMLKKHDHIQDVLNKVSEGKFKDGVALDGHFSLDGLGGVKEYATQYASIPTNGRIGNLAVGFLGSYGMTYIPSYVDSHTAKVAFHVTNTSNMVSATHPPVVGYLPVWKRYVEPTISNWSKNGVMGTGVGAPVKQTFDWDEYVKLKPKNSN